MMVPDYIGSPSQWCEEHHESYYYHCWKMLYQTTRAASFSFLFGGTGGPAGAGPALPDSAGQEEAPR
jgi:hypothetical protein